MNGMPEGEGRGWAKGRSAKDDPRIARAAASHRGKTYVSRVLPEQDRRRISPTAHPQWPPALAHAIGLTATAGSIARGRALGLPSADRALVTHLLQCLGKHHEMSRVRTSPGGVPYPAHVRDPA